MDLDQTILNDYYNSLETERLSFRKMVSDDLKDWTLFFQNNNREHFLALDQNLSPKDKAEQWINLQLERYSKNQFGHLAIIKKSNLKLIGVAGLLLREKEDTFDYEVAYSIRPEEWGKGYATEAAKKMKKFAQDNQLHSRVVSWIHPENTFSKRVAQKNGLRWKGENIEFRGITVEVWEGNIT